jgi:seryl-tRNA synthetase
MLDFREVADDVERFRAGLSRRPGFDGALLHRVLSLYQTRSGILQETQAQQAEKNRQNQEMGRIFKTGSDQEKTKAREDQKTLSQSIKLLENRSEQVERELLELMREIPNLPSDSVPDGATENDNLEVRTWGEKPIFDFVPKDHVAIGVDSLGLLDFERAAKMTGARFSVSYGPLAKLERALAAMMIDTHVEEHGYREVSVPLLVNTDSLLGTGQLPKFESDLFKVPHTDNVDFWLIPTAEVPVTNLYRDTIIEPKDGPLPHAYCALTPCFRSEAGAAGRDTHGLIRQHQFHKVEMVRFVEPEASYDELERMVAHAERILQKLELHYRVVLLCAGDLGANAAKCYDLEVWLPGQNRYREISSCSNFEAFQARRARIRYRPAAGDAPRLVHTLNGSGLAIGRTIVALLEQHQQPDGSVRLPEAVRPYMGNMLSLDPAG